MSGWMPAFCSSLTECCVGLVFNSPALGMNGTSVRWTNMVRSSPISLPSCRIASRNGKLSMSPTVPPISISAKSTSSTSRVIASLMASVMCGITCTVPPR